MGGDRPAQRATRYADSRGASYGVPQHLRPPRGTRVHLKPPVDTQGRQDHRRQRRKLHLQQIRPSEHREFKRAEYDTNLPNGKGIARPAMWKEMWKEELVTFDNRREHTVEFLKAGIKWRGLKPVPRWRDGMVEMLAAHDVAQKQVDGME